MVRPYRDHPAKAIEEAHELAASFPMRKPERSFLFGYHDAVKNTPRPYTNATTGNRREVSVVL
jgi:hypothetical protein